MEMIFDAASTKSQTGVGADLWPSLRVASRSSTPWVVEFEFDGSGLDSVGVERFKAQVLEALPDSVQIKFADRATDCES